MACHDSWVAVSPNGHSLFLTDSKSFSRFFRFEFRIIKLVFSPRGQALYAITKSGGVSKLALTQHGPGASSEFEPFFTIPTVSAFVHLIPYEKVLYLIQDASVSIVRDAMITQTVVLDAPIRSLFCVSRERAQKHGIVPTSVVVPTIVVVGDETGQISRLSFPNTLQRLESISLPFVSRSDAVEHIFVDDTHFVAAGRLGTVCVRNGAEGCLPAPLSSIYVKGEQLFFVAGNRLFVSTLGSPAAFQAAAGFSSRVACCANDFALTTAGSLVPIASRNVSVVDPRPQLMEFSLTQLHAISEQSAGLQRNLIDAETALGNLQLIRALKAGHKVCQSSIACESVYEPSGRVVVRMVLSLEPVAGYSCRGVTVSVAVQNNTFATESIVLPKVTTHSVQWRHEVQVVSPQPLVLDVLLVHAEDSVAACHAVFDILDYSVSVDPSDIVMGTMSVVHQCLRPKPSANLKVALLTPMPPGFSMPKAFVAPFGEHWTMRIDGTNCSIAAGTEATALCAMAAVLRRQNLEGTVEIDITDAKFVEMQKAAGLFMEAVDHDRALMRTTLSQKSHEFCRTVNTWIDSLLDASD